MIEQFAGVARIGVGVATGAGLVTTEVVDVVEVFEVVMELVIVEPTGKVDVSTELVVVEAVELFEVAVEFAAVNSVDVLDVTLELEEVIKVVLTASSTAVVATLRS